jgi:diguanylate cyclase (GGDEF)-like protein/PAS domain S-box-containing protein
MRQDPSAPRPPRTIGFFAPTLNGYYFGSLLAGVVDVADRGDARVVAVQTVDSGLTRDTLFDYPHTSMVAWNQLDAFIVVIDAVSDPYVRELAGTGKPLVLISREVEGISCPVVVPDNAGGVAASIRHLVEHGHQRIAFASRTPDCGDDQLRYLAYQRELRSRGLRCHEAVTVPWVGEDVSAREAATQLLAMEERPTAVVVSTDVTAIMLIQALTDAGARVPEDVAVIGFDDIEDAATSHPPLSTVAQSFVAAGTIAGELVTSALEGRPGRPGHHLAPVSFVQRQSCGCEGPGLSVATTKPTGSLKDRLAADLMAALHDTEPGPAGPLDVTELLAGLFERGGLTQARLRDLSALADRVVDLFAALVRDPALNPSDEVGSIAAALHELAPSDRMASRVSAVLRRFARILAIAPGVDPSVRIRLDDLAYDLSTAVFEQHTRSRPAEYLYHQKSRKHYEISTNLLRRRNRNSRALDWLSQTEVRAGCLALRDRVLERPSESTLRIMNTYPHPDEGGGAGQRVDQRDFPPESLLELAGKTPGDLVYLLPVRFEGSEWGQLAVVGPIDLRRQITIEMLNHWAVLLTVALDQEQTVASLVSQREHLVAAYGRERGLLEEIRLSEERYSLVAEAANDGLWDWNVITGATYYSTRWKSLLGYADHEIGATEDEWFGRVHPDDRLALDRKLVSQLEVRATTMELEYRMRPADGVYRWMSTRARSLRDEHGNVIRMVGSLTDITDRKLLEDQLRHDALFDVLTGLPNRALFLDRLTQAIEYSRRSGDYFFAVVFLDLDGFKVINDSLGHQVGDQVLVQVAERLSSQMRANDTVSRFGGDEFIVLVNGVRDVPDVLAIINRMLSTLTAPLTLGDCSIVVSAAAGIVVSQTGYQNADELIRDADTAMYRAKAVGNGASILFDESMHLGAMARLQLESDLRRAVAENQFQLYYQPIVALASGRTVGLEALIRWQHPTRGQVPPAEFLPVAEATGLILKIGSWTVEEVCRQLRQWRDDGADPGVTVSVNLSNRQFWDPELRSYVQRALLDHGVPASALVFEVTEGVIMHNPEAAGTLMRQLHEDCLRLHVDDFGTGYSSLEALHTFSIDALKIDKSFVSRINADARSRELVRIMIAMGRNLEVAVIAEGIEDEEQARTLGALGCPLVQGYLFSRPLEAARVWQFIVSGRELPAVAA